MGFFDSGEYLGVEPRKDAVDWCLRHLNWRDGHLRFRHIDVHNGYYTPRSVTDASAIAFPAEDDHYDIVMANSVFTHMLPDDIENYLRECGRILTAGGKLFCTFFMDPDDPTVVGSIDNPARYTFPHSRAGYLVQHDDCDEHVVNYHEGDVRRMFANAGIRILEIKWGSWRGNSNFVDFQDIVIGEKL